MKDFNLRKYLADNALLKEHSEVENWDNMGEEERLYTLLSYIDDPDEAESYVDASFHELPNTVSARLTGPVEPISEEEIDEVFDPEGDYDIKYEIEDYDIGDEVVVLPSLSYDPLNKQGETGIVKDKYPEDSMIEVEFDDGKLGYYMVGFVVFPGDENYIHPEDEEGWTDPAGGTHYGDEDDPAAAYIEEDHDCEVAHPDMSHDEWLDQMTKDQIEHDEETLRRERGLEENHDCEAAHPDISHEEWEFEQSKEGSPEFWKKMWKVQKESVNKDFDIKEYLKKGTLYKTKLILKEWVGGELEKRNEPLYDELVPGQGASDYVEGEMMRAINRIIYRFYNDGDKFWEDYGTETAGPAHSYLINSDRIPQEIRSKLESIFDEIVHVYEDEAYTAAVKKALGVVLDYVESKEGNYTEHGEDLFDYDAEYDAEYEYEEEEDEYDYDDDEDEY